MPFCWDLAICSNRCTSLACWLVELLLFDELLSAAAVAPIAPSPAAAANGMKASVIDITSSLVMHCSVVCNSLRLVDIVRQC